METLEKRESGNKLQRNSTALNDDIYRVVGVCTCIISFSAGEADGDMSLFAGLAAKCGTEAKACSNPLHSAAC